MSVSKFYLLPLFLLVLGSCTKSDAESTPAEEGSAAAFSPTSENKRNLSLHLESESSTALVSTSETFYIGLLEDSGAGAAKITPGSDGFARKTLPVSGYSPYWIFTSEKCVSVIPQIGVATDSTIAAKNNYILITQGHRFGSEILCRVLKDYFDAHGIADLPQVYVLASFIVAHYPGNLSVTKTHIETLIDRIYDLVSAMSSDKREQLYKIYTDYLDSQISYRAFHLNEAIHAQVASALLSIGVIDASQMFTLLDSVDFWDDRDFSWRVSASIVTAYYYDSSTTLPTNLYTWLLDQWNNSFSDLRNTVLTFDVLTSGPTNEADQCSGSAVPIWDIASGINCYDPVNSVVIDQRKVNLDSSSFETREVGVIPSDSSALRVPVSVSETVLLCAIAAPVLGLVEEIAAPEPGGAGGGGATDTGGGTPAADGDNPTSSNAEDCEEQVVPNNDGGGGDPNDDVPNNPSDGGSCSNLDKSDFAACVAQCLECGRPPFSCTNRFFSPCL